MKLYDIGDVDDDHDSQNVNDNIELENMRVDIRSNFLRLSLSDDNDDSIGKT